jgi:hypothetical protein
MLNAAQKRGSFSKERKVFKAADLRIKTVIPSQNKGFSA